MLPAVSEKIARMSSSTNSISTKSKKSSKKAKHEKKSKKSKKKHRRTKRKSSDSDDGSTDSDSSERKIRKKNRKHRSSSDASDSSDSKDEWVEKGSSSSKMTVTVTETTQSTPVVRDDWMSGMTMATFTKKDVDEKPKTERKDIDSYDPSNSARELNPFWKNGGGGLPTFQKPTSDSDDDSHRKARRHVQQQHERKGNWRKKSDGQQSSRHRNRSKSRSRTPERRQEPRRSKTRSPRKKTPSPPPKQLKAEQTSHLNFLTDQQMNELGAKIIKAEIMGNDELAQTLKLKLEAARTYRQAHKEELLARKTEQQQHKKAEAETVLLTNTNSKGASRPVHLNSEQWGGRQGRKTKSKKVETHVDGDRIRYFADDDKYDIKQMVSLSLHISGDFSGNQVSIRFQFEREKFATGNDQEEQFANIAGQHKNPNDDLDDIFAEKVRQNISEAEQDERNRSRAIRQHQDMQRTLDTCDKCFDSERMERQLIVSMGTRVYLSLPWHEPLQPGHCLIVPQQHVSCATQLDEDVWQEVVDYQKALWRMFQSRQQDVIFFETARYLHKRPHMVIHCVPNANFELAPFYFKKAIQESEREWSTNKKLVTLKEKTVRQSVPKGLPYFWVQFGVDTGFAHVIEEQDRFPSNFAQETIGGLLNLDARLWRRPRREQNPIPKVKQFGDWWKPFEIEN